MRPPLKICFLPFGMQHPEHEQTYEYSKRIIILNEHITCNH